MLHKKRVLIYSEYWHTRGGGEKYLLCIVETLLCAGYEVTVVARSATFDKDDIGRYFHVNVDEVTVRFVAADWSAVRIEAERMSGEFDICIYMTNYRFFHSRARQTFVILQVPYGEITPFSLIAKAIREKPREAAKDIVRRQLFKHLRETQAVLVYSKFVHDTLDITHNIPSTILAPAIDDFLLEGTTKERVILSVGRFFRGLYNDKRYDVLVEAFKQLCRRLPNTTWQYRMVGSCGDDDASRTYLDELQKAASGFPIYFDVNSPYENLKRHYNEATLFWHAAGFGVDEVKHPEQAEHFGMSTLEAMSARCIPVVINRGGQKEIVSHGESGYLWSSVDELVEHSLSLIADEALVMRMKEKARERFGDFRREYFADKLLSILQA